MNDQQMERIAAALERMSFALKQIAEEGIAVELIEEEFEEEGPEESEPPQQNH